MIKSSKDVVDCRKRPKEEDVKEEAPSLQSKIDQVIDMEVNTYKKAIHSFIDKVKVDPSEWGQDEDGMLKFFVVYRRKEDEAEVRVLISLLSDDFLFTVTYDEEDEDGFAQEMLEEYEDEELAVESVKEFLNVE